jgi:hypothetical protein
MRALAILGALLAAGLTIYLGMEFAIGGWRGPYLCSLALLIVYPVVATRLTADDRMTSITVDVLLLVGALLANGLLYYNSAVTDHGYFVNIMTFSELPYTWFVLWGLWQALVVATLIRRILNRRDAQENDT